jgi:iron complex transport system substrate-binding protein
MALLVRAFVGSLLALALQTAAFAQVVLHDDRGVESSFAVPPARIVSLLPSLTESVCALGACASLVGTDRFSNWPAEVGRLPKLGGQEDAQIERIVALKPDLVLLGSSARVIDRLEALGLKVLALDSQTHADVRRTLVILAQLLGRPAAAQQMWAGIEADLQRATERVPVALRGKRVYFEITAAPHAAGVASFIGETLTRLGMANAIPAELGPFPRLNPEYVVRMQPDIVMATQSALAEMARRPGWDGLLALQRQRSCGFPPGQFELLVRPGPRLGEAALEIAECLLQLNARF